MGCIMGLICAFAAYRLQGTGMFWVAVVAAVAQFWVYGVLSNFAHGSPGGVDDAPDWTGCVSMLATGTGLVLLGVSFLLPRA